MTPDLENQRGRLNIDTSSYYRLLYHASIGILTNQLFCQLLGHIISRIQNQILAH